MEKASNFFTPSTNTEKIKVCIVEDELEFQEWVLEELNEVSNIECLSIHSDGVEAVEEIPKLKPDIVIMDLTLKGSKIDGIRCILELKIKMENVKILVFSAHSDENRLFSALKNGAGAYINKENIHKALAKLVQEFQEGGAPMSPDIAQKVIQYFQRSKKDLELLNTLTKRENEILKLLSCGLLNKEIADQLNTKEGTVKQHNYNIYKKLHVNNRAEAVRKYLN